jgi:MFS family permease
MRAGGIGLIAGALLVVFGVGGLRQITGVWVRPLEAEFQVDRATAALVAALSYLLFGLAQPVFGRLADVHGPRRVVPCSVLLVGIGAIVAAFAATFWQFGLAFVLLASVGFAGVANATIAAFVAQHFERRRGLIMGICTSGAPLGQLVLAPVAAVSIVQFGWRPTLASMGAALLIVVFPIAWWLLGRSKAPAKAELPSLGSTYRLAARSAGFWLLFGSYFLCGVTTLGLIHTHIVPYGVDIGLAEVNAAQVLGLVGGFNVIGLVLAGQAADRWGGVRPLIAAFTIRAFALLWVATATNETMLVLFALIFGLTDMATIPLTAAAAADLFGPRVIGALMGFLVVAHQLGSAVGSYLAGLGYQILGSYPPVIVASAGLAFCAALLSMLLSTSDEGRKTKDERIESLVARPS